MTAGVRADSIVREVGGVIIKQHRGDAAARARHEFETLTMLRAAMPDAYTVPRAIQLDEANGSLVMERAGGTPLDVTIRDGKRERDAIERLTTPLRRAGEWLRAMQSVTRTRENARAILEQQVVKGIREAGTTEIATRLRELQLRVAPRALVACGHHGDYWPGNVFLDEQRATAIDFEGYRLGLPLEDVAYFLIQLELLMPRHARLVPALRVAFLDGYGGIDDAEALQLFTLTKTLHLIARDAGSQHTFLLAWWMRRTLRNIVRRCIPK
jgi:Ser/Thr protein kinase RdoA (MazF antagonist)